MPVLPRIILFGVSFIIGTTSASEGNVMGAESICTKPRLMAKSFFREDLTMKIDWNSRTLLWIQTLFPFLEFGISPIILIDIAVQLSAVNILLREIQPNI